MTTLAHGLAAATDPEATSALPGFLAFVAFAVLALALWFLMRNMNDRMRRMSYRQQAAHRGRDEAQAGPEDLADPEAADVEGTPRDEADGPRAADDGVEPFRGDEEPEEPREPGGRPGS